MAILTIYFVIFFIFYFFVCAVLNFKRIYYCMNFRDLPIRFIIALQLKYKARNQTKKRKHTRIRGMTILKP